MFHCELAFHIGAKSLSPSPLSPALLGQLAAFCLLSPLTPVQVAPALSLSTVCLLYLKPPPKGPGSFIDLLSPLMPADPRI